MANEKGEGRKGEFVEKQDISKLHFQNSGFYFHFDMLAWEQDCMRFELWEPQERQSESHLTIKKQNRGEENRTNPGQDNPHALRQLP